MKVSFLSAQQRVSSLSWVSRLRFRSLEKVIGLTLFFVVLGLSSRSLTLLIASAALLVFFPGLRSDDYPGLRRGLGGLYMPFVAVAGFALFVGTDFSSARVVLGIVLAFVVAMLLTRTLTPGLFALSIGFAATAMAATGFVLSSFGSSELGNVAEQYILVGKNQLGWTLSFGLVALVSALGEFRKTLVARISATLVVILLTGLIVVSESATGIISAGVTLIIYSFLHAVSGGLRGRSFFRGKFGLFEPLISMAAGGVLLLFFSYQNFLPRTELGENPAQGPLSRDLTNLTGRAPIWECFLERVRAVSVPSWEAVQNCTMEAGQPLPAHMHNLFLEAWIRTGIVGAVMLVFGFAAICFVAIIQILRTRHLEERTGTFLALNVTLAGALVGVTESYLFHSTALGAVVLFSAAFFLECPKTRQRQEGFAPSCFANSVTRRVPGA